MVALPARLLSDRGSNLLPDVTTEPLRFEGGNRVLTSSYHQQTGSKNEKSHKLILAQMRSFATNNPRDWDQLLRQFDAAYNTTLIEGTPFSPISIFSGWVSVGVAERAVSPIDVAPPGLSPVARSSFVREREANRLRAESWLINYRAKSIAPRAHRHDTNALVVQFKADN